MLPDCGNDTLRSPARAHTVLVQNCLIYTILFLKEKKPSFHTDIHSIHPLDFFFWRPIFRLARVTHRNTSLSIKSDAEKQPPEK